MLFLIKTDKNAATKTVLTDFFEHFFHKVNIYSNTLINLNTVN
jgi:hypothetical protein